MKKMESEKGIIIHSIVVGEEEEGVSFILFEDTQLTIFLWIKTGQKPGLLCLCKQKSKTEQLPPCCSSGDQQKCISGNSPSGRMDCT